jgi:tripartite-type tricarboxylate transporter receptor subunit TctC
MQRRSILRAAGAAAATLAAPPLRAQQWPFGPVRIIVGFPPGGGTDALARVLSVKLTQMWGQQVFVENKAGVAGVLAAEYESTQPSDGSTLLMAHINSHALAPSLQPKLRYDLDRDFVSIVLVGVTPNLLIANPNAQAKTVKDIVALCKAQPGSVSFGSAGSGSAQHLALEMFKLRAKVDALHIPYKGSGPLVQDAVGGHVDMAVSSVPPAVPLVRSGKLRALAVTSTARSEALPDVPTMAELGFPGYEFNTWVGVAVPKGTPKEIVDRLRDGMVAALGASEVQAALREQGAVPAGTTAEQFRQFVHDEVAKSDRIVSQAGIQPE